MTLEYLKEQKEKYEKRQEHFKKLGFDIIASDFQSMVSLIKEMESHIKENVNGKV